MKTRLIILILAIASLVSLYYLQRSLNHSNPPSEIIKVVKGPLSVWSTYEGKLEAQRVTLVMSKFSGRATVIELASDGAKVSKGDMLVRFDSSSIQRELFKLEREYALAESELKSFKYAKAPLELRDLKINLMKATSTYKAEKEYLEASVPLVQEELVSEQEIEQQKLKVAETKTQLETQKLKLQLTKEYLHPSALKQYQSKLASAEQELQFAREQSENSIIRASIGGKVVYKPLYIGSDFRMIRIGDSVYPNQPFMAIPDTSELVVHCEVPEVELARVQKGKDVFIQPLAFSEMNIPGIVKSVSSMAQPPVGRPSWQRFFHVLIRLNTRDFNSRLRPGMSVTVHILSYHNPKTILIPRTAVMWESGKPYTRVVADLSSEKRQLKLGMANESHYEVIEGLKPGEEILRK